MESRYGNYRTRKFTDIFGSYEEFEEAWTSSELYLEELDDSIKTLYYLLYARYGNSHIASSDEFRFAYQLFSIIWIYGPTWQKKIEIQEKVRALTDDEIFMGARAVYNKALHPQTEPGTYNDGEVPTIDEQNVTNYKKSKMDAYSQLYELLRNNVTTEFIERFKKLFLVVATPDLPLWYTEGEDEL